jgi:hypothetical protein
MYKFVRLDCMVNKSIVGSLEYLESTKLHGY